MKRFVLIFFVVFPLALFAQKTSRVVAVMEPANMTDMVTVMQRQIVRGGMETAVVNASGYEGYDRTSFDAIMHEQNFKLGTMNEVQYKQLGEMAGVQYIVVPEITAEGSDFYILVKMFDVEKGKFGAVYEKLCENSSVEIKNACSELGKKLFEGTKLQLSEGTYVGETLDGKPHGRGIIYYNSESEDGPVSYDGEWINGEPDGYGVKIWRDGDKYEGNWKEGRWYGQGTYYCPSIPNVVKYEGNWVNGEMEGFGTVIYTDGSKYEGDWKEDEWSGKGVYYYEPGDKYDRVKYEGDWINGFEEGFGTEYYSDGDKFVGHWKNGMENGEGTYYWSDGDKFVGNYKEGVRYGRGVMYFSNGDRREGNYLNGKLNGPATYYSEDGGIKHEMWENGVELE